MDSMKQLKSPAQGEGREFLLLSRNLTICSNYLLKSYQLLQRKLNERGELHEKQNAEEAKILSKTSRNQQRNKMDVN